MATTTDRRLAEMVDRHEIRELLIRWAECRDRALWDELRDCFTEDGAIAISWIVGSAEAFVEGSKKLIAAQTGEQYAKHVCSEPNIRVNGRHGFCQTHVEFMSRIVVDGYRFDWAFYAQFLDLVGKCDDGKWRIHLRTAVYERDRLDPVLPHEVPRSFWDSLELDRHPPRLRFMYGIRGRQGRPEPVDGLTFVRTPEEDALRARAEAWLASG